MNVCVCVGLTYSTVSQKAVIFRQFQKIEFRMGSFGRNFFRQQYVECANRGLRWFAFGDFGFAHEHYSADHISSVRIFDSRGEGNAIFFERSEWQLQLFAALHHRHQVSGELHVLSFSLQYLKFFKNCLVKKLRQDFYDKNSGKNRAFGITSTSRLLATSSKCSWCSRVLSSLSSVIQNTRSLASNGSTRFANTTNLKKPETGLC